MDGASVQLLLDRADISAVPHNHATAIDTRNWELLTSCFTEDLEADSRDFGGREVIKGRDAWLEIIKGAIAGLAPYEYICKIRTKEPKKIKLNSNHQRPGPNT